MKTGIYVNGHELTGAERRALFHAQDWLKSSGGDSCAEPNCSPTGDGRWVPLAEIFPRGTNRANAARKIIRRLHEKGILVAYEIAFHGDCVKAVPAERVREVEREMACGASG